MNAKKPKKEKEIKKIQAEEPLEEMELEEGDEEIQGQNEEIKGGQIPKQAINYTDEWIKANITDPKIAHLLKDKREADNAQNKALSRKIRRSLRDAGFYVSKNRED